MYYYKRWLVTHLEQLHFLSMLIFSYGYSLGNIYYQVDDCILPPVEEDQGFIKRIIGGSRKDYMRNLATQHFKDIFYVYLQLLINEQLYAPLGWSSFQKMMFLHGLYTGFFNCFTHSWSYHHSWTKFDDRNCLKVRFSHITSGNFIYDK